MKRLLLATAMLAALALPASAATLNSTQVGQSGTQTFDGRIDDITDPVTPGLSSSVTLTLTSVTTATNVWNFNYSATNSSTFSDYQLWGFGFNTSPNLTGATMTGSVFNIAQTNSFVDGGLGFMDFCGSAGFGCLIGQGDGLNQGLTTTGTLSLDFTGAFSGSIQLTDLFALYERPGLFALHDAAGLPTGTPIQFGTAAVPGPLMGAGLPGLVAGCLGLWGFHYRRRQRAVA
jgi:hypothetical protein